MEKNNKRIYLIIGICLLIVIILGGTYAWYGWINPTNTEITFTINGLDITSTNTDISGTLYPTSDQSKGVASEFTVVQNTEMDVPVCGDFILTLTTLPNELKHESFRYRLYNGDNLVGSGNFKDKNQGDVITIATSQPITTTVSNYKLYLWIDGLNYDNPISMGNKTFLFNLNIVANQQPNKCTPSMVECDAVDVEPNKPELADGMIPIRYDGSKWVKADSNNTNNTWYNYSNKEWANAVMVTSNSRSTYMSVSPNTEVKEEDILAYYVWIPRYRYQLFNVESKPVFKVISYDIHPDCVNNVIALGWYSEADAQLYCSGQQASDGYSLEGDMSQYSLEWVKSLEDKIIDNLVTEEHPEKEICTEFERNIPTKMTGSLNGTYLTHPAFTFGTQELTGIWVGKFETSVDPTSACYNNENTANCDNNSQSPRIKPNVKPVGFQKISNQFVTAQKFGSIDYLTSIGANQIDAHMMKNIEWGVVAYLKQSKYGLGLTDIGINNNFDFITGCGAPAGSSSSSNCNEYNTSNGMLASTTGNITGVYDMSGGGDEYVMAVMQDNTNTNTPMSGYNTTNNSGFNGMLKNGTIYSDGISFPNSKYYDLYRFSTTDSDNTRRILGDATGEVNNWYMDPSWFVSAEYPWFHRGGRYGRTIYSGVFASFSYNGVGDIGVSFRSVLAPNTK